MQKTDLSGKAGLFGVHHKPLEMKIFFFILLLLSSLTAVSQNGRITGTVVDDKTGETLVGVSVVVPNTVTGTSTDLDGRFTLSVAPGAYQLQVSYISYETLMVDNIRVGTGETVPLGNMRLKESTLKLEEVVVAAEIIRTTEASLNTIRKQSAVMLDGISSSRMRLTGDNTAAEAVKRVTGISVEDGKYIYVRGLGDRYSKTTLNGVDIPGLDPDRNSLQLDILPSGLIDNMLVSKNFTADMPADFTGGAMNVETKDFPEEKIMSLSVSTSYNPDMHFNSGYLGYSGGRTDFLGFDDGTRALPAGAGSARIPTPISGHTQQEVADFIKSFNPELGASRKTSPMDLSLGFTMGNQFNLSDKNSRSPKLGYIFSLTWKSDYKFYDDVFYGEYQRYIDPDKTGLRYATRQTGEMGERNVLAGVLGGLALKTKYSRFRLTGMRLQNGESRAGKFRTDNNGEAVGQSGYRATSDNLEYNQRSLTNFLFSGTHVIKNSGWEMDWRISPTLSTSDDPDIRKTAFTETESGSSFMAGAGGNPTRIWRSLSEWNAVSKLDVARSYSFRGTEAKLRLGVSHTYKQRDYEILFFDVQFFGGQSWPNPDPATVLNPENLWPNRPNSIYYQSGNPNPNPNAYESNVHNTGVYVSNELDLFPGVKTILGVRMENFVQRHTGRDQRYAAGDTQGGRNFSNRKVLESVDFFPSFHLIYSPNVNQKLRLSWSETIARPSFKELSFAQILDPISNRIFNGSLFTYPGWDGKLSETRMVNLDLRWELFQERGQMVSVSAFYKTFDKPIELVRIPEQQTSTEYQPRNVGDGRLLGVELELRKDLGFIAPQWKNLNVSGNVTVVKSAIDMTELEYNSRKTYEKPGETISATRQMAGQSPYVINGGLGYNHPGSGLEAGLFYNVKGPTLAIVGAGLFPDIYAEPFQSLNFSLTRMIGPARKTTLVFRVSNILDSVQESRYHSYGARAETYSSIRPGRSFSFGMTYRF